MLILINWGFMPHSTLFQSHHKDSSHIQIFPGFHQCWATVLKYLAQATPVDSFEMDSFLRSLPHNPNI